MDGNRLALALLGVVGAGLAAALWLRSRQAEMADEYSENARRQAARSEATNSETTSSRDEPDERATWTWVAAEAWPRLDAVNAACEPLRHCDDLPGPARAPCIERLIGPCEEAIDSLEALPMRTEADGLFVWRIAEDRRGVCTSRVNLLALREHPQAFARVRPEEALDAVAYADEDRPDRPAWHAEYTAELEACFVENRIDLGETERFLRAHFGCVQVRTDGRAMPQCCTAERASRMYAAGIDPAPTDPTCTR